MRKVLFCIFLISALATFVFGLQVMTVLSLAFYHSGDSSSALQTWLSLLYWLPLLIAISLWLHKEKWAAVALIIVIPTAIKVASTGLRYNGWPTDINLWCNMLSEISVLIMIISGFAYCVTIVIQKRRKTK